MADYFDAFLEGVADKRRREDLAYRQKDAARRLSFEELESTRKRSSELDDRDLRRREALYRFEKLSTSRGGDAQYVYDQGTGEFRPAPGRFKMSGRQRPESISSRLNTLTRLGASRSEEEEFEYRDLQAEFRRRGSVPEGNRDPKKKKAEAPGFFERFIGGASLVPERSGGLPGLK